MHIYFCQETKTPLNKQPVWKLKLEWMQPLNLMERILMSTANYGHEITQTNTKQKTTNVYNSYKKANWSVITLTFWQHSGWSTVQEVCTNHCHLEEQCQSWSTWADRVDSWRTAAPQCTSEHDCATTSASASVHEPLFHTDKHTTTVNLSHTANK